MRNYMKMFQVNTSHNLAQKFLTTYVFFRKQKFVGRFKVPKLENKTLPKPNFYGVSIAWGIACAMAATKAITIQTDSLTTNSIDSISYFLNFFGAFFLLTFFSPECIFLNQ